VIIGSIYDNKTAIYDPITNTWTQSAKKEDISGTEETWTPLPDNIILTVECKNHPRAEKYVISKDEWVSAASTPVELVQDSSTEIGPAILLPNGNVFAIGATGHTAIYTSPASDPSQQGSWIAGPDFPPDSNGNLMQSKDAPACLLPNGRVLCVAGPAAEGDVYPGPTQFFEYDGTALTPISNLPNSSGPPFTGRMLLLPTGQVLFAASTPAISVYTPDGNPDPVWRPQIINYVDGTSIFSGAHSQLLVGKQLNGLSQAVSYGDDATMATNYPFKNSKYSKRQGRLLYYTPSQQHGCINWCKHRANIF
jgi:hypothetical protein